MSTDNTFDLGTNPAPAGAAQESNGTNPAAQAAAGVPGSQDQGNAGQSGGDVDLDGDDSGQQAAQPEELEDIEHEGKKYAIPKALKPLVMFQADYTQKTQEHAERARQFEAEVQQRQQELQFQAQVQRQHVQQHGQIAALDQQIAQYQAVNWPAAMQQDPTGAQAAWMQFQQLKDQRGTVAQQLQASESQLTQRLQQQSQQAQQRALAAMGEVVSKWSPDVATAVNDIGRKAYGIGQAQLTAFAQNPVLLTVLHDAVMYRRLMDRAASPSKPAQAAAPAVTPAPTLPQGGGNATPRRASDSLPINEWMRREQERLRPRHKR